VSKNEQSEEKYMLTDKKIKSLNDPYFIQDQMDIIEVRKLMKEVVEVVEYLQSDLCMCDSYRMNRS
jgi:hypothetical protein